jgi:hypothetical protein
VIASDHPWRSPSSDEPFSGQLERWLLMDGIKTVGGLGDVFGKKTFATTILLLMFVPALPLPTGGITHVFEAITVIVAAEMVLGVRKMWIPRRMRQRDLGSLATEKAIPFMARRIRWFERFSRPRWASLVSCRWFQRVMGIIFIGLAIAAGIAPPFSGLDTLPAMGAVIIALGLILEDIVIVGIGIVTGTGGIVLIVTVGAALFNMVRHLL